VAGYSWSTNNNSGSDQYPAARQASTDSAERCSGLRRLFLIVVVVVAAAFVVVAAARCDAVA